MGLVYTLVMIPAICISFVNPIVSFFIYSLIVVVFIISTALGRGEIVMSLPATPKSGEMK